MGEPVLYEFHATGNDTVAAAFESVGTAAQRSADKAEAAYKREQRASQQTASRVAADADKAARDQQKAADKSAKDAEKAAQQRAAAADKATAQQAKANAKAVKDYENAEKKKTAALLREQKQREQAAARAAKAEADMIRKAVATATGVQKAMVGTLKSALGIAAAGAASVAAVLGKASSEVNATQNAATRIAVNGGKASQATSIRHELEATAVAHAGQTSDAVAGGVAAYQEHRGGDRGQALDEARRFSDVIATVASATGKGADEIGQAAALISKSQGPKTVDEMGQALARLVTHARETGQPLSEAIGHLDKLSATAKRFGIKDQAQLGALQTLGAQGAGAAGGDKAVEAFLTKIKGDKVARTLKGAGADPYADKNGTLKDPRTILAELYGKVGRSDSASDKISTIGKLVGGQGAKMLAPLNEAFGKGYGAATGSNDEKVKAGVDAMLAAFDKAAQATGDYSEMKSEAAAAESTASAQMTQAWEKVKAEVGSELAPQLADLAVQLANTPELFEALKAAISVASVALEGFSDLVKSLGKLGDKDWWLGDLGGKTERLDEEGKPPAQSYQKGADGKWELVGGMPPATGTPVGGASGGGTGTPTSAAPSSAPIESAASKLSASADKLSASADKLTKSGGSIYGKPALDGS